jgi:hypothetical protein
MSEKKNFKVEFAPGAFDNFEGTQEELDELLAEIEYMFVNKSRAEIEAMSQPLSEIDDIPPEVLEQLMKDPTKRNLQ